MQLIDTQQVMLRAIFFQSLQGEFSEELARHAALNIIRATNKRFRNTYGPLVLAFENKTNWRKTVFPYYKQNRKTSQDASAIDWIKVLSFINVLKDELMENFPYKTLSVEGAEADDIIGVLASNTREKTVILSADTDFLQLQKYSHISQYDPIKKKMLKSDDPVRQLKEKIIRGDTGDGVPNIRSADDCLVLRVRQNKITSKFVEQWIDEDLSKADDETLVRNWKRNQQLIDLSHTPKNIVENILNSYDDNTHKNRSDLLDYMRKNRLREMIEVIDDF